MAFEEVRHVLKSQQERERERGLTQNPAREREGERESYSKSSKRERESEDLLKIQQQSEQEERERDGGMERIKRECNGRRVSVAAACRSAGIRSSCGYDDDGKCGCKV